MSRRSSSTKRWRAPPPAAPSGWSPGATSGGPTGSCGSRSRSTLPPALAERCRRRRSRRREAIGSRDDVAHIALTAAVDAFTAAGLPVDGATRAGLTARFGRDPYAFVLFGRGVAQFSGVGVAARAGVGGEPALKTLGRSLVIDPNVAETRHYLGIIHLAAGRPGHARAMWSSALELRPDYLAALSGPGGARPHRGAAGRRRALRARAGARPRRHRGAPRARRAAVRGRAGRGGAERARARRRGRAQRPARAASAGAGAGFAARRRGARGGADRGRAPRSGGPGRAARSRRGADQHRQGRRRHRRLRRGAAAPPASRGGAQAHGRPLSSEGRRRQGRRALRAAAPRGARRPAAGLPARQRLLSGRSARRRRAHVHRGRALPRHARRRVLQPGRDRRAARPGQGGAVVPVARGASAGRARRRSATTTRSRCAPPSATRTRSASSTPPRRSIPTTPSCGS